MSRLVHWSVSLLVLTTLAACGERPAAGDDAAAPAVPAAATPDAASATTGPAPATPPASSSQGATLTEENVDRWFAAQKRLTDAAKGDEMLGASIAQDTSEENREQYTARLESNAKIRGLIEQDGFTVRDYVHTGELLLAAMMAESMGGGGNSQALPEGVDAASVEFVRKHKEKLAAQFKQF
jgi:hypothetical protein